MRSALVGSIVVLPLLFFCTQALALDPIPGEERFDELIRRSTGEQSSAGGEMDMSRIGEDYFLTIRPRIDLNLGPVGLGLQVPLNLRVIDLPPMTTDNWNPLRKEDWDEPAEYLKFVKYVRFGHKRDFIYARAGELVATIGHGTIVNRYANNTNVNTFRLGLQFDLNTNYAGFETLIADVGAFDPNYGGSRLFGGRAYVKPLSLLDPTSFLNIFQIGGTFVIDENAPFRLLTETLTLQNLDGTYRRVTRPKLDAQKNYVVDIRKAAVVWGVDVEAEVLNNAMFEVIPYVDLNFIYLGDAGLHLGVNAAIKVPIGIELTIPLKIEYRHFGRQYIPAYFGSIYELERVVYQPQLPVVATSPKSNVVRTQAGNGGSLNGWYGEMAFDLAGYVQVGALYEDFDNSGGGTLGVFAAVPAIEMVQAKAYYGRYRIHGVDDIFALDERSLLVAQARIQVPYAPFIFLVGRWARRWEPDPITHEVRSTDDWKIGIDCEYKF